MRGRPPKLTEADVLEIRRMYAVKVLPWSITSIAKAFGVSVATVHHALNGTAPTKESHARRLTETGVSAAGMLDEPEDPHVLV